MCIRDSYIGVGRDDGKAKGEYSPIFYKKERFRLLDEGHFMKSSVYAFFSGVGCGCKDCI